MDQKKVLSALKEAREQSKKRNFKQRIDLIFNLKGLDIKKTEHQVDVFVPLNHDIGTKIKTCALIGPELLDEAKANCDMFILVDDFAKYAEKKKARKLAEDYDYFIAQANIMPKIAASFGRVFGVRGKMPNPKSGAVVPPKTNLKPVVEKLSKTVRLNGKMQPLIQVGVGSEDMKDEDIASNIMTIYDSLIHHLPAEKNNIKSAFVKLTMGKTVRLE